MSSNYKRRSIRLPEYDYTQPGAYFITCVTHNRTNLFGEINTSVMKLNALGIIVQREWQRLVKRFSSIKLDEYVIMPNHIHGIIEIIDNETGQPPDSSFLSNPPPDPNKKERFGAPVAGSISTIIRSFKSSVTQQSQYQLARPSGFIWQQRYYEHIIRNEADWERIRGYIQMNPQNWESDEENSRTRGAT
jgi:REP element-mobilizing transposase RayT